MAADLTQNAEELLTMGLYDIARKQRRKYIAAHPSKLISLGEKKIEDTETLLTEISHILPALEAIPTNKKSEILVRHYEGKKKIKSFEGFSLLE